MSESPEKKLLKKTLAKLKEKSIESQEEYIESIQSAMDILEDSASTYSKMVKATEKFPEELSWYMKRAKIIMNMSQILVYFTFYRSIIALEDWQLYVSTLEEYSGQLDGTLREIFDAAKEEMEKLEAKRKELEKRQPKYID